MALALVVAGQAVATPPNIILEAAYAEPTTRYDHGVLGDAVEWGALRLKVDFCTGCEGRDVRDILIRLPENRVFEDIAPRLVDVEGAGASAVMVVESDLENGARLALYHDGGLLAATPFIGQRHRWLAPVGAADLDGDGTIELAYVDRPHLAKTLRVWRFDGRSLSEVAAMQGVTNHKIGWDYIAGGIRTCGDGPEMIVASADWTRILAVRFTGALMSRDIAPYDADAMRLALSCK